MFRFFSFFLVLPLLCVNANDDEGTHSKADLDTYVHELTGKIDDLILKVKILEEKIELLENAMHTTNAKTTKSDPIKKEAQKTEPVKKNEKVSAKEG